MLVLSAFLFESDYQRQVKPVNYKTVRTEKPSLAISPIHKGVTLLTPSQPGLFYNQVGTKLGVIPVAERKMGNNYKQVLM